MHSTDQVCSLSVGLLTLLSEIQCLAPKHPYDVTIYTPCMAYFTIMNFVSELVLYFLHLAPSTSMLLDIQEQAIIKTQVLI